MPAPNGPIRADDAPGRRRTRPRFSMAPGNRRLSLSTSEVRLLKWWWPLAVSISSLANGALGEHSRHETHEPSRVLEVLEPQPIGSAFEPEIEIPQ